MLKPNVERPVAQQLLNGNLNTDTTDTDLFLAHFPPVLEANIEALYDILNVDRCNEYVTKVMGRGRASQASTFGRNRSPMVPYIAKTDETKHAFQKGLGPSGSSGTIQFRDLRTKSRRSPGRTAPLFIVGKWGSLRGVGGPQPGVLSDSSNVERRRKKLLKLLVAC